MGGDPLCFPYVFSLFSFSFFCFLCILKVVTSVETSPYPFYFVFVPRITSIWKKVQLAILCPDFCALPKTSVLSARTRGIFDIFWAPAPGCYLTSNSSHFLIWATEVPRKNSSLQPVLFWQISANICICVLISFCCCSFEGKSFKRSCDSS